MNSEVSQENTNVMEKDSLAIDEPFKNSLQPKLGNKFNLLTEDNMPKKRFFRSRAHCNPLSNNDSFIYPISPSINIWLQLYPNISPEDLVIRIVDIGMGFGGLSVALSKLYHDKCILGMEIRAKVCEFVKLRIDGLRQQYPGEYQNVSCLRTNCMRYLPNYFSKGQLEKMFFCFADPHFKQKNHRRRIISTTLLSEYAYFLQPKGRLYTITDVEDLHKWQVNKLDSHPLFRRLNDADVMENDPSVLAMHEETEEGIKVKKLGGKKYFAVYERVDGSTLQLDDSPLIRLLTKI